MTTVPTDSGSGSQQDIPQDVQDTRLLPSLSFGEWATFTLLAGVVAAANIDTTLLIGWGGTGSIIAVLASVLVLVFAAGAVVSILVILVVKGLAAFDLHPFYIAG